MEKPPPQKPPPASIYPIFCDAFTLGLEDDFFFGGVVGKMGEIYLDTNRPHPKQHTN